MQIDSNLPPSPPPPSHRTFHKLSKMIMAVKVLVLDATPEEQKQIKSELEILHKVSPGMVSDHRVASRFHST